MFTPGCPATAHHSAFRESPRRFIRIKLRPPDAALRSRRWDLCPRGRRESDNARPRLRGEHPEAKTRRHTAHGSSPLTRGAPRRPRLLHHVPGLIPAYAGSTPIAGNGIGGCWAHPRLRGEHTGMKTPRGRAVGSSPLTRGAPRRPRLLHHVPGLIPAYAGSTPALVLASTDDTAHPRLRGEHPSTYLVNPASMGSSPLTRGARHVPTRTAYAQGLIPAYAGSTRPRSLSR